MKRGYPSVKERFWSKVDKSGGPDACWPWKAGRDSYGYGAFALTHTKQVKAHRFAYELAKGHIPVGLDVLHDCDNPPCCNLVHLWSGTNLDNIHDRDAKGRTARGERQGLHTHPETRPRGERNGHAKLTEDKVREIMRLFAEGKTQAAIARLMGVSYQNIWRIVRGKSWQHVLPEERGQQGA